MKTLMICTLALAAVTAFGETAPAPAAAQGAKTEAQGAKKAKRMTKEEYDKLSPAEKEALHKAAVERRYRRTGGFVVKPGSMAGELVYVNCQKRANVAWLDESIEYFKKETKFNITLKDGAFDLLAPKVQGNASLFIVDDEKLPPILLAPESRWAMINIAPLAKGRGEKPAFFEARVKKQLTRGFAMLCGATNSQFPMCLTGGVKDADALDTYTNYKLPVDVLARFAPYLRPFGVTPAQISTYRHGCQEGWALKPTNDVQKAIWDEVHQLPNKPLKIEFDPKKDK